MLDQLRRSVLAFRDDRTVAFDGDALALPALIGDQVGQGAGARRDALTVELDGNHDWDWQKRYFSASLQL